LDLVQKTFEDVDYVFHEAAIASVPRSIKDPVTSNYANVNGTLNVLVAARDNTVKKIVYASSIPDICNIFVTKINTKFCIIFDTKPKINCIIFVTKREEGITESSTYASLVTIVFLKHKNQTSRSIENVIKTTDNLCSQLGLNNDLSRMTKYRIISDLTESTIVMSNKTKKNKRLRISTEITDLFS